MMAFNKIKRHQAQEKSKAKSILKTKPLEAKPAFDSVMPDPFISRRFEDRAKPKETISTSKILKRKPMRELVDYPKKRSRRHKLCAENNLLLDHQGMVNTDLA
jgi:hypothetical protein